MNPRRSLALALAAGVAGVTGVAAAPGAQAASVGSPAPCVRVVPNANTFPVVADGFAPGAFITFKADGVAVGSGTADQTGHFDNSADPFFPPVLPFGTDLRTYQLTADDGAGTVAGPVPIPVTNVVVRAPANSAPRKRVRFRVFGFAPGEPVYLHVRRGGRTKGRFSLGTTSAPCGTLSKRMRFMPLRRYSTGTYRYYFSHSRRFDRTKVIYEARVRIYRIFSSQATAAGAWG